MQRLPAKDFALVRRIVVFGSAARGDTHPDSDVDLLIDTSAPKQIQSMASRLVDEFEQSVKVTRYWQLLGIRPVLSLHVERVEEWRSLHPALLKDGRVLYGPFHEITPTLGQAHALLWWKNVTSTSRTNLYRALSGYVSRTHRYPGLLAQHQGQRVAKGALLVPLSSLEAFKALFRRLGVAYRVRVLYEMA